jgi:hypothetical protein
MTNVRIKRIKIKKNVSSIFNLFANIDKFTFKNVAFVGQNDSLVEFIVLTYIIFQKIIRNLYYRIFIIVTFTSKHNQIKRKLKIKR